ncbi:MAG: flavoprotein [Candidatus Omnitrophota bacterium]
MGKNVLLGVTASVAAYKACDIAGSLCKKGYSVRCVMSRDAAKFIAPLTLETITGRKVAEDMFSRADQMSPVHISLADEADIVLVAPATADVIGKVAGGICDDILTCAICSVDCPVIFAPAMNDKMFRNGIVQDNIKYLKSKGYHFIDPVVGHLACGREGMGHLAPLEKIVEETERFLAR